MDPSLTAPPQCQSLEHQLERRYKASLFQLKAALGLCSVAVPIPPHIVVCKAVALLRYQFSQIQKEDAKQSRATPWDHPKYRTATKMGANTGSSNSKHIASHHDTRQFYANTVRRAAATSNPNGNAARFCPAIGGAVDLPLATAPNVADSSAPPIDWGSDDGLDTVEIDRRLKTETEQKLGIKAENESTADTTNELSNEWDGDHFAAFDDDIDFDVPLQMQFDSQFL